MEGGLLSDASNPPFPAKAPDLRKHGGGEAPQNRKPRSRPRSGGETHQGRVIVSPQRPALGSGIGESPPLGRSSSAPHQGGELDYATIRASKMAAKLSGYRSATSTITNEVTSITACFFSR